MRRLSTFVFHHASHPWSQHPVLVWLLCFSRQFWSSINRADYMALRLGFITTHQLPLTYDFHNYMLRSMEEEFRDIVGISVPLWIYAIACIFLDFHGTDIYFWLSFLPAILILLIGTKLHRIVVKLAVEIVEKCPRMGDHQFNLRNELFWFGKPQLLLWTIQFISFQNAFEMASFLWPMMGSKFKRSVISENVRQSLSKWHDRVKARQSVSSSSPLLRTSFASFNSMVCNWSRRDTLGSLHSTVRKKKRRDTRSSSSRNEGSFTTLEDLFQQEPSTSQSQSHEISHYDEKSDTPTHTNPLIDSCSDFDEESHDKQQCRR